MDVIFVPQRGRPFSIEVGFFDTVLEIKEKIQKYQGIPIARETLVFNEQVLQDERDIEYCEILQNSHVRLIIAPESEKHAIKIEESSLPKIIQLLLRIPTSNLPVSPEVDVNDTIRRLKEKIHEMESVPVNQLVLHSNGTELRDHQSPRDCQLSDHPDQIDVTIRPSTTASAAAASGATARLKKLKLMVLLKGGTKKFPVEVNASDNVGELKKKLQKLHQFFHFHLPPEGYLFIYKKNVMDNDRSFQWHQVGHGDTIEIFNGSITN